MANNIRFEDFRAILSGQSAFLWPFGRPVKQEGNSCSFSDIFEPVVPLRENTVTSYYFLNVFRPNNNEITLNEGQQIIKILLDKINERLPDTAKETFLGKIFNETGIGYKLGCDIKFREKNCFDYDVNPMLLTFSCRVNLDIEHRFFIDDPEQRALLDLLDYKILNGK